MTTISQYVDALATREIIVAKKLGVDLNRADKTDRVLNRCMLVMTAVLTKAIVDKGLATDAEMLALLDSAAAVAFADLPIIPPDSP
jgi:hypothetical protein